MDDHDRTGHDPAGAPPPPAGPSDGDPRNETPTEQLDRNWNELLQELRVTQTGVQLLTGFLLSLPFQQRFSSLTHVEVAMYLTVVVLSLVTTGLLLTPVSMHRLVFRLHERRQLVRTADITAKAGLATLGLTVSGVAMFIFHVTEGPSFGYVVGVVTLVVLLLLWVVVPLRLRGRVRRRSRPPGRPE